MAWRGLTRREIAAGSRSRELTMEREMEFRRRVAEQRIRRHRLLQLRSQERKGEFDAIWYYLAVPRSPARS